MQELQQAITAEPRLSSTLLDSELALLLANMPADDEPCRYLKAEAWLRFWLYAGECPPALREAGIKLCAQLSAGFSEVFQQRFAEVLRPLRTADDGKDLLPWNTHDDEEARIWGLLTARVRCFLDADGMISLVRGPEAIAVPFSFRRAAEHGCVDLCGTRILDWAQVVSDLAADEIVSRNCALRIDAVVPKTTGLPGGRSLALAVAIASARREARDIPLFSALNLLATGDIVGAKLAGVRGTHGQQPRDPEHGAKGQLSRQLGVPLFASVDLVPDANRSARSYILSWVSGTPWARARIDFLESIRALSLGDSRRHLRRAEMEDTGVADGSAVEPQELWSAWRRLGWVVTAYELEGNMAKADQSESVRREILAGLGFRTFAPGYVDFSAIEERHTVANLSGRDDELGQLDRFLKGPAGVALVTAPVGHGKSALLSHWRRRISQEGSHDVFYHYFDQNDDRLRGRAVFLRRLLEHLLLRLETQQGLPDGETTDDDLLVAWDRWRNASQARPLLLIVDGLDEAGLTNNAEQVVADICRPPLPKRANLPAKVWIVTSCRAGRGAVLHPSAVAWKNLVGDCLHIELKPLRDKTKIEKWIAGWEASLDPILRKGLPPRSELANVLLNRSEGAALSIRWLLNDVGECLRTGQSWDSSLATTPVGLTRQVFAQWRRLGDAANSRKEGAPWARDIALYLVAARGALANRELVALLELSAADELGELYFEARRWIDVRPADPARRIWGRRFSLNAALVREVFQPASTLAATPVEEDTSDGEAARLSELIATHYEPKLIEYCAANWKESPYALRHYDEHLIAGKKWPELDGLIGETDYLARQRAAFPDEPALALGRVRRALEAACAAAEPDIALITELVLTHAKMVRWLTQPTRDRNDETQDLNGVLRRAEEMTKLPVQWEPAATRMWHLLAAWLAHKKGNKSKRDLHLGGFAQSTQKVPVEWAFLAAVLLLACFDRTDDPQLVNLARRFLPADALPRFAAELARRDASGRLVATRFVHECIAFKILPKNSWLERRATAEVMRAWGVAGEWQRALGYACEIPQTRDFKVPLDRCLELAQIAASLGQSAVVGKLIEFLLFDVRPQTCKVVKSYEVIGQLAALRIGSIVGSAGSALDRILGCEDLAEAEMGRLAGSRPGEHFPAFVTIECALAEAFAGPIAAANQARVSEWRDRAVCHWEKAVQRWTNLKNWNGASTLEIFQHAMWLAQTTLHLANNKVWPDAEAARKVASWVNRVRTVIGLEGDGATLEELLALPATATTPREVRRLEPRDWDQAVIDATRMLLQLDGTTPQELANIIRSAGADRRGVGLSSCVAWWHEQLPAGDALRHVTELLDAPVWKPEDSACGWAHWARCCLSKGEDLPAALGALRAFEEGVPRPSDWSALSRAELAVALAMQYAEGPRRDGLCAQAISLVNGLTRPLPYAMNVRMDLAIAARGDPRWRERFLNGAKALLLAGHSSPEDNADAFAIYGRGLAGLGDTHAALTAFADAQEIIGSIRTATGRMSKTCEIAEACMAAGFVEVADRIFREARDSVPPPNQGPLGTKPKELRPLLIVEWLSGVAKALTKAVGQASLDDDDCTLLCTWSEWVINPSNRDRRWADPVGDSGEALLKQFTRTNERDEAFRARVTAARWRAQFDMKIPRTEREELGRKSEEWLVSISSPAVRTRTERDLAIMDAQAAYSVPAQAQHADRRARAVGAGAQKDDVMHRIAGAFADNYRRAQEEKKSDAQRHLILFLTSVSHSADSHTSAYLTLANLIQCFPRYAKAVDEVLVRRGIIGG